ncbi:MAG: biopolymer transporter ExbD [Planctomycetota bacterium]|nr:biopolymer transporter ExbD [Planctomycetota bacterium]
MKIPSRNRGGGLKFNLTPMIDVVFNLIIFFLVASHYAHSEATEEIELPGAGGGEAELEQSGKRLTITLLLDGRMLLGPREATPQEIEALLAQSTAAHGAANVEVRIRTDRRVPYGRFEPLLLTCAKQGVTRVRFAVLKE